MKIIISVLALGFVAASVYGYNAQQQNRLHAQQLQDYEQQVSRLMSQVEDNSHLRLSYENRVGDLESELNTLDSQLTSTSNELDLAQTQLDPDYRQLERRVRRQVTAELQRQTEIQKRSPRLSLLTQLSALDPTELGQLMSLHGQFGGFLQNLDASDERKEVIVAALSNLIADQTQARMDLMMEMRSQQLGRGEMRSEMQSINSLESQLEALAFDLTEDELASLSEHLNIQAIQQGADRVFNFQGGAGISQGVPIFRGGRNADQPIFTDRNRQSGQFIQSLPGNPRN